MNLFEKSEWLEKRRQCITGTDIGGIVGVNKYSSPMMVFMDKIGLLDPLVENEAMKWGKLLEPVIASRYADDNAIALTPGQFLVRDEIIGGTPDYLSHDKLIEIKTAGIYASRDFGEPGSDQIPDSYMTQVQWYLNLTDREHADLVVLIAGQDYRIYPINRNQTLIDILLVRARRFWEDYIVPQIPPRMDNSVGSEEFLKSFFPRSNNNMLVLPPNVIDYANRLKDVRLSIVHLEKEKAVLENEIKYEIGTNDGMENDDYKITWKSVKNGLRVDWEKVAKEANVDPAIIEKYTSVKADIRRFMFQTKKEN